MNSYGNMAKYSSIAAALIILIGGGVGVWLGSVSVGHLAIFVVCAIVAAGFQYLVIWLTWRINAEKLAKKGYRW